MRDFAPMDDLIAFLHARLDEDERAAREANYARLGVDLGPQAAHIAEAADTPGLPSPWNPDRVLADVEAKRRIIDLHETEHECSTFDERGDRDTCTYVLHAEECSTLRLLALPYDWHRHYNESWRP